MGPKELVRDIKKQFSQVEMVQEAPDLAVKAGADQVPDLLKFLRDTPGYEFNFLRFITAVDRIDYLEVVYCLWSIKSKQQLLVKVAVPADKPEVPSVVSLWPAADCDERETYDLLGIIFTGHPNLTRILLPDDWEGHPLRKSYPVNKRPSKLY